VKHTDQKLLKLPNPRPELSDLESVPAAERTVRVSSLLAGTEKRLLDTGSAVFIRSGERRFLAHRNDMVPADSEVMRGADGHVFGIPAVTGG